MRLTRIVAELRQQLKEREAELEVLLCSPSPAPHRPPCLRPLHALQSNGPKYAHCAVLQWQGTRL